MLLLSLMRYPLKCISWLMRYFIKLKHLFKSDKKFEYDRGVPRKKFVRYSCKYEYDPFRTVTINTHFRYFVSRLNFIIIR